MKFQPNHRLGQALLASAMLSFAAIQPATATIIFQAGNLQYTNVNIAADTDALSIVGDIGNTGIQMTFQDMIGPDCTTQVSMHGQHGVAFVESTYDSTNTPHTGFCALTLMSQAGYGWTGGDFALDQLNTNVADGQITLTGVDQFGTPWAQTFAIDLTGQNQYNFHASGGELVTGIDIAGIMATDPTTQAQFQTLFQDIKQVSLNAVPIPAPEPATLALLGVGLIALGVSRRRASN